MPRKVLGRGLEALIPPLASTAVALDDQVAAGMEIPVGEIEANPYQPRTQFDDDAIQELAASIRATGVLQPVLVRRQAGAGGYQLVAGERRLRAAKIAGINKIPAIIRKVDDREMMELSLIENIQRENLNPIEEAKAYNTLAEKLGLTHDQISERVGKQRVSITNSLRLLGLPSEVQEMVSRGTLSAGHARALLAIEKPTELVMAARYVQAKGFSVRRTEAFVRRKLRRMHSRPRSQKVSGMREWEVRLQQKFSTRVTITPGRKGGKVEFEYYGQEDLERLLEAWGAM
ncbi:MAG: ParB/RepB/Spo0J family partition protein [Candidatus Fermentibacter sp.]|nr:ParB/RepB/Spo0J family partition protein [Candidatus Fermentibacter sp.]